MTVRSATGKATTTSVKAVGLSATERTRFEQKLVGADLAAERKAAQALKAEATREGKPRVLAVAAERLALIEAEAKQRARLAPLGAFVAQLTAKRPAELAGLARTLKGDERLAVQRELARRAGQTSSAAARGEATRLDALKRSFRKEIARETPAQLGERKAALDAQLAAASARPRTAAAERTLRELYARRAVVDSLLPVPFDRQKMHAYAEALKPRSLAALQTERTRVSAAFAALTEGAVRGSRKDVREAEVKLAIVDAAIARKGQPAPARPVAPVSKVDRTRNPGNVVFEGPGMFVASPSAYPAAANAAKLRSAGVTWVSLQVHNPGPVNEEAAQAFVDSWRAAGFKVGVWGVSYGNAAVDGATAAQQTKRYGADFYIADCEGSFQAGEGDPARNRQFVEAFQREATRLGIGGVPRALSSMGRVALDMKPWIDGGWDAMPQAYWNDFSVYEPTACAKFYEDWGWPKDRIHLTIGTYQPTGDATPKSVADYVEPLKRSGLRGFSYYLPESYLDDAGLQQLRDGIAGGMNG